jgi:hypothetical protein
MDVLTEEELRTGSRARTSHVLLSAAVSVFAVVVFSAIAHHEAWADEAQSWLLARDASLLDLWTRLLHYEGTPGLWQTLLHGLIETGLPYAAMNVFAGLLGLAGACVFVWRAPFPLGLRCVLPFTFFLCYQYSVTARSYSLLPVLLFACAALYDKAGKRPAAFISLLCLLAAASVHGMILAAAIGLSAFVRMPDRKRLIGYAACFAGVLILMTGAAWPAHDGTFITGLNLSASHFAEVSGNAFATAFTGEWISSLAIIGLTIPLLSRGGGWLFFVLSSVSLCAVASAVYSQVWHHGILFLAWVFAIWVSFEGAGRWQRQMAVAALAAVAVIQCYWTTCTVAYDWRNPYSGSQAAANGIRELELHGRRVFAIGFACTAIQPYFPHNVFANVNDGRPEAYWDWSQHNHVNLDSLHLVETRPDYVILGYKNEFERGVWTDAVLKSGYSNIRHFEGNSFWQARIFEPDSYDLYKRSDGP